MAGSANLNVMIQAARKAARRLVRDFNEVENLQVSVKGVGDFVSNADRRAEEIIRDTLMEARPNYGFLGEEGSKIEGKDGSPEKPLSDLGLLRCVIEQNQYDFLCTNCSPPLSLLFL